MEVIEQRTTIEPRHRSAIRNSLRAYRRAIEREAAAPAATEALRAALERLVTVVEDFTDLAANDDAMVQARVALASPEPTPDSGLDVERLAEAIRNVYIAPSASRDMDAKNIVREYARLSEEPT